MTASAVSEKVPPNKAVTVAPLGLVVSSLTAERVAAPVAIGASLTAVIEVPIVAVALEMAVLPPVLVVLTVTLDSLPTVLEKPAA